MYDCTYTTLAVSASLDLTGVIKVVITGPSAKRRATITGGYIPVFESLDPLPFFAVSSARILLSVNFVVVDGLNQRTGIDAQQAAGVSLTSTDFLNMRIPIQSNQGAVVTLSSGATPLKMKAGTVTTLYSSMYMTGTVTNPAVPNGAAIYVAASPSYASRDLFLLKAQDTVFRGIYTKGGALRVDKTSPLPLKLSFKGCKMLDITTG